MKLCKRMWRGLKAIRTRRCAMKAALSVLVAFFAFSVVRGDTLFWAKLADDTTLSWDIPGAWKQVYSPWDFVNRLPTNADTITLNSAATALAGEGIDAPHSLRITNGVAAVALADLLLERADAKRAVEVLREADVPPELAHAEAVLETRALRLAGRTGEADFRWRRYIESRKGADRKWV